MIEGLAHPRIVARFAALFEPFQPASIYILHDETPDDDRRLAAQIAAARRLGLVPELVDTRRAPRTAPLPVVRGILSSFAAAAARMAHDRHDWHRVRRAEGAARRGLPWAGLVDEIRMVVRAEAIALAATSGTPPPPGRRLVIANNLIGLRTALAMARRHPVSILYDAHELEVFRRLRRCGQWREMLRFGLERAGILHARTVVAVGQGPAEVLKRLHRLDTVIVVHNDHFRDVTVPASRPRHAARGDRPNLVFFGSPAAGRHLEVAAAATASARFAAITVFAVGDPVLQAARLDAALGALPPTRRFWRIGADYEGCLERWRRDAAWPYSWVVIAPETVSYRRAVPNKLFQSLRARIPIIALAGTEQGAIVARHNLGLVVPEPAVAAFDPERLIADHADYVRHIERLLVDIEAGRVRL